ncbi:MAG TPA: lytic murein transglycosylase B [Gammaproteobacteria bacterium]|nr:lytic murein transglycosylase B [Gammaproteobacteria bacterium]
MRLPNLAACLGAGLGLLALDATAAFDAAQVDAFVAETVREYGLDEDVVRGVLGQAEQRESILAAMRRPAEAKPWHAYRKIFLTPERIEGGVAFMREHAEILARAEQEYGVPPQIVTAIIGVETFYGRHTGSYRVVDALATLGFAYPPRAKFFRSELGHFLQLVQEEPIDPLAAKGSYAGAMGLGQFIPSSYRAYTVDFDADGTRDLWGSKADAIGSVANYFARHRWRAGEPVALPVAASGALAEQANRGIELTTTVGALQQAGLDVPATLPGDAPANLVALEQPQGEDYWLGLHNLYVITRYNRSVHYAMAVYQLSEAIRESAAGVDAASG